MEKPTLCLIFGGKSSEYEVSLASAYSVLCALEGQKYEIVKIGITRDGKWYLFEGENKKLLNDSWQDSAVSPVMLDINGASFITNKGKIKPSKILPILHGEYGEDGRIGALFEIASMPYAGCGSFCSFLSMDKHLTKLVAKSIGIKIATGEVLFKNDPENEKRLEKITKKLGYPLFIKPSRAGSSVGVSLAKSRDELDKGIKKAFLVSSKVLIEEKINGVETELAIMVRDGKIIDMAQGQIKYFSEFYDYNSKYKSENEYIIPAKISKKTEKHLRECAKKLVLALDVRGLSRLDFFVLENGDIVFNEINTMPGFTEISMFPKLFLDKGYTYFEILNNILNI